MTVRFQPGPADSDIPLAGDASRLWTTDDASAELPDFAIASDSCAGESGDDALMHGDSYV